ncbi:jg27995 [Pararge aegeria aegeria]|uniref:Jg27995 protein n=1 Tax=Pararge aegeria aegeria TaxID=348720 RepID=A0A8S4QZL9_9NEOP|nr:jg27995 [Pararge aegeria aegeria]
MIALKKLYGDELLRLALVLSLLKANPEEYLELETQQLAGLHISNGSDWSLEHEARTLIRPRFVHPKSLDHILVNYERQLFEELNSLGRYNHLENNDRMWYNQGSVHTYLVNNVATDTIAPGLSQEEEVVDTNGEDNVSSDDNVAQEVKVEDEAQVETQAQPDAVVTLSANFFENHTESDIFTEIASRSFDVNEFLVPNEMQIKKETDSDDDLMIQIKKEREADDLYSDNAIDDFVPYFTTKSEKLDYEESDSVFHQNLADLQDYGELYDDVKELKNDLEFLDVKHQQENLEQYLLENTPLDTEVYELAPMFEEELVLDVKRERASTSFTSASSSGVSEMDNSSVMEMPDVKLEPDEGHHTGDELTQEVS